MTISTIFHVRRASTDTRPYLGPRLNPRSCRSGFEQHYLHQHHRFLDASTFFSSSL
jgi:hypothetical protein